MHGEIDVERFMAFAARQRGMIEWIALKEYWRAEPDDKPVVLAIYGQTLKRALRKWQSRTVKGIDIG